MCHMGEKYTCIHAEANALAKCISEDQDKVMICSLAPCVTCASLMANSGIRRVFYLEDESFTLRTIKTTKVQPC